jgi:Ca2+-binding EF-hand superfamily protein
MDMKILVIASLLALAPLAAFAADHPGQRPGGMDIMKWDANGDGVVTKEEAQAASAASVAKRFDELDLNKDGQITKEEISQAREARQAARKQKFDAEFKAADKNGDGGLSKEEATASMPRLARHFDQLDANKDGVVTLEELQAHHQQMRSMHQRQPQPQAPSQS